MSHIFGTWAGEKRHNQFEITDHIQRKETACAERSQVKVLLDLSGSNGQHKSREDKKKLIYYH